MRLISDCTTSCTSDVRFIYEKADTLEKRELIDLVFDSNLYYENGYLSNTWYDGSSITQSSESEFFSFVYFKQKKGEFFNSPSKCTCRDSNPKPSHP